MNVREIGEDELGRLVEVANDVDPQERPTVRGLVDWKRQAEDTAWLLAEDDAAAAGAAVALVGWHLPRHIALTRLGVRTEHRNRGAGGALLDAVCGWARERQATELEATVREDDPESLAWAGRRGFHEVGRNSLMVLDLHSADLPPVDPPEGVEIVSWADRPELARGIYEVALEAAPDIPGNEDEELGTFEEWLARDMQGDSDRPDATFVAVAGAEVIGFAKLSLAPEDDERAFHDLTGVRRAWRGRGIAAALKRRQIEWAKDSGFERLQTFNEERNEPIRRLNARYGYRLEPGHIVVRGPLATSPAA